MKLKNTIKSNLLQNDTFLTHLLLIAFIVSYFVDTLGIFRTLLGFVFILFLPGYSLTSIFFPSKSYNDIERIIISLGLSLALSSLLTMLILKLSLYVLILPSLISFIFITQFFSFVKRKKIDQSLILEKLEGEDKEGQVKRSVVILSVISTLLVVITVWYFKFFPTIITPQISDLLITALISSISMSLALGALLVRCRGEACLILLPCLLHTFTARSIIYLRLPHPPLHDPYVWWIAFLTIDKYHTLDPIYSWRFQEIEGILHWPLLLLITENLHLATGLENQFFFKFQQPLLGTFFFLAVFLLAKEITRDYGSAILAALFSSLAPNTIFYQSEYHAQGLVLIFVTFLLYFIIRSLTSKKLFYIFASLIFAFALIFSHYFSSIFVATVLSVVLLPEAIGVLVGRRAKIQLFKIIGEENKHFTLFTFIIVSAIAYHLYSYPLHMEQYLKMIFAAQHPYQAEVLVVSAPFPTNVIKNMRLVLFVLAIISIFYILKSRDKREFYLALFLLSFLLFAVVGNFFVWLEVGRVTLFYESVAGIFGALTLFRFREKWCKKMEKQKKEILVVFITSMIITSYFFGGTFIPAYYFKSLGIDEHYWCSNRLPNMYAYPVAGNWIKVYTPIDAKYIVDSYGKYGFTEIITFFWGERPIKNNIETNTQFDYMLRYVEKGENTYLVLNSGYEYQDREYFMNFSNLIYANGEIEIHTRG